MEENKIYCSHCGALIEDDDYETVNGDIVCTDCYENHTTTCDRCGSVIWSDDSYGDEYTTLCSMRTMLITLTVTIIAATAIMTKLTKTEASMTTDISLSLSSMAILADISA